MDVLLVKSVVTRISFANSCQCISTLRICHQETISYCPCHFPSSQNVTMEVDAATLGLLIDHVAWDVVKIAQGRFFEGDVRLPLWLQRQSWEKVLLMLEHYQRET